MLLKFGVHWLARHFVRKSGEGKKLEEAVAQAKAEGAVVYELNYGINEMSPGETARALKAGGIEEAVICIFFPNGEGGKNPPWGDPLSKDSGQVTLAVSTIKKIIDYVKELRRCGIEVNLLVGPGCFVLNKDYGETPEELRPRVIAFCEKIAPLLKAAGLRMALEPLRDFEDKALCTVENVEALMKGIDTTVFGILFDTHHFRDRGYDIVAAIKILGRWIIHLHLNGKGRMPPGYVDTDHPENSDDIPWNGEHGVIAALKSSVNLEGIIATNEPFCEEVPEMLRAGLPKPLKEPEGIRMTKKNLEGNGLAFVQPS